MPRISRFFRYDHSKGEVVEVKKKAVRKTRAKWPILSDAVGGGASQVAEANRTMEELGLKPNYHPDGRYEFESAGHRKAHCQNENIQVYDRNGGYGDPMPQNKNYFD